MGHRKESALSKCCLRYSSLFALKIMRGKYTVWENAEILNVEILGF